MVINVSLSESRSDSEVKRTVSIHSNDTKEIDYVFRGRVLPEPPRTADSAALSAIHMAMYFGQDLHIDGVVSHSLLENLEELNRAQALLHPKQYHSVQLSAAEVANPSAQGDNSAVIAFSGGVDSTAALLSHLTGKVGRRKRDIKTALLVHGFDVPLHDTKLFQLCAQQAHQSLATNNIPLTTVSTNWRSICTDWENEHLAGLASCLAAYSDNFDYGIVAADDCYRTFTASWGNNPVLNSLLSSDAFTIQTDNHGINRCDKIEWIAESEAYSETLRVCWKRPTKDHINCGKCEKCIRTKMNFMAHGKTPPATLGGPAELWRIALSPVLGKVHLESQEQTLNRAKENGIRAPWLRALQFAYFLNKVRASLAPLEYSVVRPVYEYMRGKRA